VLTALRGGDLRFSLICDLLDNASKPTHSGHKMELRAFDNLNDVVIEGADQGPGILGKEFLGARDELCRGRKGAKC